MRVDAAMPRSPIYVRVIDSTPPRLDAQALCARLRDAALPLMIAITLPPIRFHAAALRQPPCR